MIQNVLRFLGFSSHDEDEVLLTDGHSGQAPTPLIRSMPIDSSPPTEIRIANPTVYEDSVNIATHLQHQRAVIVNLQQLNPSAGKRLIDFLCGTTYAMNGTIKKINDQMFIFAPQNMVIQMADDISDIEKATEEYDRYKIENATGS